MHEIKKNPQFKKKDKIYLLIINFRSFKPFKKFNYRKI